MSAIHYMVVVAVAVGFFVDVMHAMHDDDVMHAMHDDLFVHDVSSGGCVKARLCCPGKDLTCSVYERLTDDAAVTRCFCDSDCLATGDCCHDYHDYCQPVDCVVDEAWQKWRKCSVRCGMGVRNRTRRIIRYPRNGGSDCESTVQYGHCEGVNCKVPRTLSTTARKLKEIALLLPLSVARWRNDSTYNYVRRNSLRIKGRFSLRSLNGASRDNENYCAIYRITEVGRMCNAATKTSINASSSSSSSSSTTVAASGQDMLTNWTTDLVSGMVICVECQPTAASPSGGDRCQGDGVYARQTRWAAVTVPGCKGKWTMIAKPKDCQCLGTNHHQHHHHHHHQHHHQHHQHDGAETLSRKSFIFV